MKPARMPVKKKKLISMILTVFSGWLIDYPHIPSVCTPLEKNPGSGPYYGIIIIIIMTVTVKTCS